MVLTEEEWVRQNFVKYLILKKGYAEGLIGIEKSTKYNLQKKRMDIVAYNNSAEPILIVECKSFSKPLTKEVLNQVASYNLIFESSIFINYKWSVKICFRSRLF